MDDLELCTLDEPIIGLSLPSGESAGATLPGVLARLSAGDRLEFSGLQAHQLHAWHAFLTQLAALALHARGEVDLRQPEARWRELLAALTDGEVEPWCLVVGDLGRPALLQPPVPEGTLDGFKEIGSPAGLDLLVTAKNHDVKSARVRAAQPEHWLYALVALQGMQGFTGRDNYGVARMFSGFGSRPAVAAAPDLSWPARFARDVGVWLEERPALCQRFGYPAHGGHALLWLLPWDGLSSIHLQECDPFFLEICRRSRLSRTVSGVLRAHQRSTKCARIDAKQNQGDTGDIWTPVDRSKGSALTLSNAGFSYKVMQELLFASGYQPAAAQRLQRSDKGRIFVQATAMVRGQGKTEGLHERLVLVPPRVQTLLRVPQGHERLSGRAKRWVDAVATVRRKVLHTSLCVLLQADPDKVNFKDARTSPWTRQLDRQVDPLFFLDLWALADEDDEVADAAWARRVLDLAKGLLSQAIDSVPLPSMRRWRAMAAAERCFAGTARKRFPDLYAAKEEKGHDPSAA